MFTENIATGPYLCGGDCNYRDGLSSGTLSSRYRRSPARNRDSFLALADTLLRNFTISDLKELDVDCDLMREVASSHSHLPLAAMLVSKLQTAQPTQVSNVINIQDSVINRSEIG